MPIVLEHVTLRYPGTGPTTRPAVDDLSLVVEDGEYLGVIGHTGSGKSTLALLMAGLMTATAGTLTVNGADLAERSARRALRRQVGIVFQYPEHQLFADTVADDVAFGPRALGFSPAKVAHAVDEALQRVDMELCTYGHRSPFDLSEGQMRRVAIAGVLAARPDILILDEPMAGLDPAGRAEIATLLRRLHDRGLTIVMVSHDMDDIASLADKVLVLRDGRRFAHGTPAEGVRTTDRAARDRPRSAARRTLRRTPVGPRHRCSGYGGHSGRPCGCSRGISRVRSARPEL